MSYAFRVVGQLGVNAHGLFASILQIRAITAVARPAFAGHRPRLRRPLSHIHAQWRSPRQSSSQPPRPLRRLHTRTLSAATASCGHADAPNLSCGRPSRSNNLGGGIPEGAAGVAIVAIFTLGAVIGVVSYITIRNAKTQSASRFNVITDESRVPIVHYISIRLPVQHIPLVWIQLIPIKHLQLPSPPSPYQSITSTIRLPSSTPDSASITSTSGTQIYASMYDSEPMRDDAAVVLTGDGRHGASSENPLAVLFLEELSVEERKARPEVEDFASREIPLDRYVYYRLYNRDGETRSSAAFDSVHTALGRIERAHITPPATVDSLKSCIAKVEHKHIWKYADLYEGTAPRDPLGGSSSIGREMGMGGDVNSPLLLVQPERKLGLFNRPARMLKTRKYRQSEKLTYDILQGTIMQTDGVVKDSMCECVVPGLAERAMLKRKWFELLDE
ncbi:hypothetical protein DFH07DRAFT_1060650 [Mycena maculata]|uniref:Uncharacterized protein n=1 Tax=Mycena maculata TaxID=230809 RepID=A0AAD7J5K7_9AGAR|nr:hypothetical protein DFH07DRAFT_1060650 [Mycena maculata]